MEKEIHSLIRVTFDDVFELAKVGCNKSFENEPEIKKIYLVQIENLHKIYKTVQSDEMKAMSKLNKFRPTGRPRSPNLKNCPVCKNNMNVVKNGLDKRKRQRFRCNTCRTAFF